MQRLWIQAKCMHTCLFKKNIRRENISTPLTTLISLYFQQIVLGMRTGDIVYCDNLETHGNLSAIGHTSDIEYKVLGNVGSSVRQLIIKGRNVVCLTGNIQLNLKHTTWLIVNIWIPPYFDFTFLTKLCNFWNTGTTIKMKQLYVFIHVVIVK